MNEKNNSSYLISIGIGPVQDFIASARRSRDLWFGSWLLSELSKAAAKSIGERNLIFPNASESDLKPNSPFNVVNKILAEIKEKPEAVGKKVKDAIDARLEIIRNEAYKKVSHKYFLKDIAEKQVDDLVEYFWTAIERTDDYVKDRDRVEKLFSARKATRNFNPVTWGDNVPKSSLDGQRESVIHEDAYGQANQILQKETDKQGRPKLTKEQLRTRFGVKEGERLCGVGLLKRHGNRFGDDSFFSTSHVASLPLLERLTDKDAVERYINRLKEIGMKESDFNKVPLPKGVKEHQAFGRYDGHLLFEERLSDYFEPKEVFVDTDGKEKKALEEAKKALLGEPKKDNKPKFNGFLEKAFGKNIKPLPYYALVLADGDFMGKAIDAQDEKDKHQKLSGQLSEFAGEVGKIIENERQGSLIYSGGDDVLAFVGLHKVLEYADKLAKDFKEKLEKFDFEEKGETKSPTLSVGIAVVHHLEPLEDALELVRRAEKAAKSVDGKNALAVVIDKRSGASRIAKGTWGTLDDRLQTFIKWHRKNSIPDGAAYELRDLAIRLDTTEFAEKLKDISLSDEEKNQLKKLIDNLNNAKQAEAIRILGRKKQIEKATLEKLKDYLNEIKLVEKEGEEKKNDDSIVILADELIIAKMFADAEDLAGKK